MSSVRTNVTAKGKMMKSLLAEKRKDRERKKAKVRRYERFAGILPSKGTATKALLEERKKEQGREDTSNEKKAGNRRPHLK
jgi:hypothetical protein